jgi:hypothetical protein
MLSGTRLSVVFAVFLLNPAMLLRMAVTSSETPSLLLLLPEPIPESGISVRAAAAVADFIH